MSQPWEVLEKSVWAEGDMPVTLVCSHSNLDMPEEHNRTCKAKGKADDKGGRNQKKLGLIASNLADQRLRQKDHEFRP